MNLKQQIILFDGVCNLCNRSVQFIIKRDTKKKFLFASLQGKSGQALLKRFNLQADDFNSFILIDGDKIYSRSAGALRMLKELGGGWKLFYAFMIVPRFIRDAVYNWVARNRHKWYGKREECMVPTPELKERFLD
ncbi:MAG TPA: thiol-disulfide oxidoreductase DCC family protein [Chitinophagaceae bacterium]